MRVIGLTGSIAAGKSAVASILNEMGAPVIDADIVAREVVEPNSEGALFIKNRFGNLVFKSDGTLDRAALANIVFADENARKDLEEITHPLIKKNIDEWLKEIESKNPDGIAVVSAALLLEAKMQVDMDEVWVVICDDDARLKRLMERNSLDEKSALLRMNSQMPQEQKILYADVIIDNSADINRTREQVVRALKKI